MSTADHAAERVPTPALGDTDGWRAFSATIAARVGTRGPLEVLSATAPRLEAALCGRPLALSGRLSVAESLRTMIRIIDGHDIAHCAQIERILNVLTDA